MSFANGLFRFGGNVTGAGTQPPGPAHTFVTDEVCDIQLYVPSEIAHATVSELGELNKIQFKDLNPDINAFQRIYVSDIRKLDESERRLRFLTSQLHALNIPIRPFSQTSYLHSSYPSTQHMTNELFGKLSDLEVRIGEMEKSYDALVKKRRELEEARGVLRETGVFFKEAEGRREEMRSSFEDERGEGERERLLGGGSDEERGGELGGMDIEFVAGTIDRERMETFERVLWRVLRGNLYMNWTEIDSNIDDPAASKGDNEKVVKKNVFIIFAHGSELVAKIRKISSALGATLYPIDSSASKRQGKLVEITSRIEDLSTVLYQTDQTRRVELVKISEQISAWWAAVKKEKLIFATLNLWKKDEGRRMMRAEGWVPKRDLPLVKEALRRATEGTGTGVQPILHEIPYAKEPPTYHRTNKFTEGYHALIDAYGMATYGEINPGLFTVITFPFLFAVMFGDIGHGFLMFLAAAAMILVEKRFPRGFGNELLDQPFYGRYIIILMGLFSIWTGLLYNDIFSLTLPFSESQWVWPEHHGEGPVEAIKVPGYTYPFGMDHLWHGADNYLLFANSLKMKMSIIFGVVHMSFAICLQIPNFIHFKHSWGIWAEWLPQFLFMQSIFGYLVVLIIYKWATDWSTQPISPPSLLQLLIYMFLSPGNVNPDEQLYSGQAALQVFLLLLAAVCVPWMLCAKPYILWKEHHAIKAQGYQAVGQGPASAQDDDDDDEDAHGEPNGANGHAAGGHDEEEFDFGEICIHQAIHTIEFCLGCISNTASYLRLWALSLAHAQLSEVLWEMTVSKVFFVNGPLGIIISVVGFGMWFGLTVAILIVMEGLSAFLHALRLHWVEFNNKFYGGAGYVCLFSCATPPVLMWRWR
ncbi:ATPase V0 A0 complex 116-kDa subunit [Atractiella rhizophila]|nr:ATPase V0 A0 complex 116-kDa subunit [Atractiella rhizophila]